MEIFSPLKYIVGILEQVAEEYVGTSESGARRGW
jgi:hypothetical protein